MKNKRVRLTVLRGQKVIELPFGVDQNIGWLEISMDDAVLMKIT